MRVLWISECPWNATGFGKVTYYITRELRKHGIDVVTACFATTAIINYDGVQVYPYGNPFIKFVEHVEKREGEIDTIVLFGSPWIKPLANIVEQVQLLKRVNKEKRVIGYFVHEAVHIPRSTRNMFKQVHLLAVPTSYTAKVLGIERYHVVPHGVEPSIWRPDICRGCRGTNLVGMIAKNHPRKRWDLYFEAIARAIKMGNIVIAYPYVFSERYWLIANLMETVEERFNVKIPMVKPFDYEVFFGLPEEEQARLLSMLKVHMLVSMGEAWGLPITETLALGIPNITTRYGAVEEWCKDYCIYVEPKGVYYSIDGMVHPVPSAEDVALKLHEVLNNYDKYAKQAKLASDYIRRELTWEKAGKEMIRAIEESFNYDDLIIEEELGYIMKPKVIE